MKNKKKSINIIILDNDTGDEVYAIRNVYRAFDFHWVKWEKDSYNFSLYSGDLGTFDYEYQGDDTWERHVIEEEANLTGGYRRAVVY